MQQASVYLDTHFTIAPVDPRIFSGFVEHLGRAVYEGIYDPGNALSDRQGFRQDVMEKLRAWRMPLVRYPGGNYVSACDWKDTVGPAGKRPRRPEFAWRSIETNQFGVDEFVDWCRAAGTAPMLAVNLGTGPIGDAGQLVEYCNLPGGTFWSDQRKANGHAEPHDIKIWCLGNEMDGPWQAGHVPADVYAHRAAQAAILMKGIDKTIETVVCGSCGTGLSTYMAWDRTILDYCWPYIDYISAHRYSANRDDDTPKFLAEGVAIDSMIEDYAAAIRYVAGLKKSKKKIHISFDEWNVWYKDTRGDGNWAVAPHLCEELYNLEDALVCAQYLSSFLRHADTVKIACIAQIINVISPILTRKEGLLVQSTYYPLEMFARLAQGSAIETRVTGPIITAGGMGEAPALDASATFNHADGMISAFLVNRSLSDPLEVKVALADRSIDHVAGAQIMHHQDVKAANTWENQDIVTPGNVKVHIDGPTATVTLPGPSFAAIQWQTRAR